MKSLNVPHLQGITVGVYKQVNVCSVGLFVEYLHNWPRQDPTSSE